MSCCFKTITLPQFTLTEKGITYCLNNYFHILDDGEVDFDEFMKLVARKLQAVDIEEEILDAFRVFDKDGNGSISKEELRLAITTLGEKVKEDELDELVKFADLDGDGTINYTGTATVGYNQVDGIQ